MRLTNIDRDSFVKSVMNDVPRVDYSEKAHALIKAAHEKAMPPEIKAVYDNPALRTRYLKSEYFRPCSNLDSIALFGADGFKMTPALADKISALSEKSRTQSAQRTELREKVRSAIYGCNTLKQALELMPEFEKYLPQDRDGKVTRNVPAIGNLVTDLMTAGWPKKEAKK